MEALVAIAMFLLLAWYVHEVEGRVNKLEDEERKCQRQNIMGQSDRFTLEVKGTKVTPDEYFGIEQKRKRGRPRKEA